MTTHDLRTHEWCFARQADPDGITSIIHVNGWSHIHEGDFILVSSRYRVRKVDARNGFLVLHCEHAPRTLAEVSTDSHPNRLTQIRRTM